MRRFFQFRLRALFVVVTLAAIAALWWSHRLHCLARAAFHRVEIVRCEEQKARERDEFVVAYAKQQRPKREPPPELLLAVLTEQVAKYKREEAQSQAERDKQLAEREKVLAEVLSKMEPKLDELIPHRRSRSQRWEDQTIYDSMAQGFLVIPSGAPDRVVDSVVASELAKLLPGHTTESNPEEPDLVSSYEARISALEREIAIRKELSEQYLQAIFRPWMRADEDKLTTMATP
jgi:hypothetical protein